MANKKNTRRALFMSVISMILCCSMLVGTTFAWFTDSVVTGMNTIQAGNLDVELLANGEKVEADTKLFNLVDAQGKDTWWEPGMVVYENLQVSNVGSLALKYQMTLNFGNENNLNGHKLSEVLKVAVLDESIASNASRETVLEKAKAKVEADQGVGTLSNFYLTGELEAKTDSPSFAVVIFWGPNDNATDNLYNANNDQVTSDKQPLHIEFGVNLQATQKMSEKDSFGPDYDKPASILPKATVNNTGAKAVTARPAENWNNTGETMNLDTSFQFLPNETAEEAEDSEYRYWHADYVVSVDRAVPANSMALAGYYKAFGDFLGTEDWVALTADEDIAADTEIRLLEALGATVNYGEICNYANDGIGFLCGAADLTGENGGTTLTVELRLYETEEPSEANGNSHNVETGNFKVIGTYRHTFGKVLTPDGEEYQYFAGSLDDVKAAFENGGNILLTDDIKFEKITPIAEGKEVYLNLDGHTITVDENTTSNTLIWVKDGAKLVVDGNGTIDLGEVSTMAIFCPYGELVINNGTFIRDEVTNVTNATTGLFMGAKASGCNVTINGGYFDAGYYDKNAADIEEILAGTKTLTETEDDIAKRGNSGDKNAVRVAVKDNVSVLLNHSGYGSFKVYGGTFVGANPAWGDEGCMLPTTPNYLRPWSYYQGALLAGQTFNENGLVLPEGYTISRSANDDGVPVYTVNYSK